MQTGNATAMTAIAVGKPVPPPPPRPAGAGRYVCAVLMCADADVDVAPLLGLARSDVLLIAVPGPFASAEAVALLERAVADERLSLVLVLGHDGCQLPERTPATNDALTPRLLAAAVEARRRGEPLPSSLAKQQAELLRTASTTLQAKVHANALRILPCVLAPRTGAITCHAVRADVMPLAPVK